MTENFGIDYTFESRCNAETVLNKLKQIAMTYGLVRSIDFAWIVGKEISRLLFPFGITDFEMRQAHVARVRAGWTIVTPTIHLLDDNGKDPEIEQRNEENELNSKPIFITIHAKELESPGTYISDIFKNVNNIKDRMVNIAIMP